MKNFADLMAYLVMAAVLLTLLFHAESVEAKDLKPLMLKAGKMVLNDDFEEAGDVSRKTTFRSKQGTPWVKKDGFLWGEANSLEVQAQRTKYKGKEARGIFHTTPTHFIAHFDFTYSGGEQTTIAPFIEFGHHVCRLGMKAKGSTWTLRGMSGVHDPSFQFENGRRYEIVAELFNDEFVLQFKDGPTYYIKHDALIGSEHIIGLCGTKGGNVKVDQVRIWEAAGYLPNWGKTKQNLDVISPTEPKKSKEEKKAERKRARKK